MENKLRIVTGVDDFKYLMLNTDVFVDKSLFIKDFLEGGPQTSLITRPRRWGKSLNMSMLEYFLKPELDSDGKLLPEEQRTNHKLFLGGEVGIDENETKHLKPLKISNYESLVRRYQGKWPVINISFKGIKGDTYKEIVNLIKDELGELFAKYYYLLNSDKIQEIYKNKLQRYIDGNINLANIKTSLHFLSRMLHKHHGREVFILIDEYDAPINEAYLRFGKGSKVFHKVLDIFRVMLGKALKTNDYLTKGLVTGILRIAKANIFSELSNLGEYTLLDDEFNDYYGFSEQEVNELLTIVPVSTSKEKIKHWYNGYTFGGRVIYNPWSIMNCISRKGKLSHYWIDTGGTGLIDKVLVSNDIQKDLQLLISGECITYNITSQISFEDLDDPESLISLLLFAGYLNPVEAVDPEKYLYNLAIPNYEVKYLYERRLLKWLAKKLNTNISTYQTCVRQLISGNVEDFREELQELLQNISSFHQRAEMFYSGFMLGIVSCLESSYYIESERESGKGRADLIMIPKEETNLTEAIIIEYKVSKEEEDLLVLAEKGLAQIDSKGYDTKVKAYSHVTSILKMCLAFYKNEVKIEYKVESLNN